MTSITDSASKTPGQCLTSSGLPSSFPHHVVGLLEFHAGQSPDQLLIECGPDKVTYGEMQERSRTVAGALQQIGLQQGDRLAIICTNRMEIFDLYFGAATAGVTQVPLNAYLKGEFLRYQIADSEASVLATDAEGWAQVKPMIGDLPDLRVVILLDPEPDSESPPGGSVAQILPYTELLQCTAPYRLVDVKPTDLMSILYTSGTTGLPKGCMLPHGYYVRSGALMADLTAQRSDDVLFTALPAYHAAMRILVLAAAIIKGSSVVVEQSFSASQFLKRAAEVGATLAYGVGATGTALLATPSSPADTAHRIRTFMIGPFSAEQQAAAQERFRFDAWGGIYGQTECTGITTEPADGDRHRTSIGRAGIDLDVAVLDEDGYSVPDGEVGEISIRPRHPFAMFSGYWGKPESTLDSYKGLWYHSGDLGVRDETGYFTFVDRKKDAIRRRGENISSFEVETTIAKHELVEDVAIHGVASGSLEDDVKAVIVSPRAAELSPEGWFKFFEDNLPYFAVPRYVEFASELPRNAVGRLMKFKLREHALHDDMWDFNTMGLVIDRAARR